MSSSLHRWQGSGCLLNVGMIGAGAGVGADGNFVAEVEVEADVDTDASVTNYKIYHESKCGERTYWEHSLDSKNCSQA
jgi:hypothetical protein